MSCAVATSRSWPAFGSRVPGTKAAAIVLRDRIRAPAFDRLRLADAMMIEGVAAQEENV